jgi:uncharacterized protein (TIGR03435 family)
VRCTRLCLTLFFASLCRAYAEQSANDVRFEVASFKSAEPATRADRRGMDGRRCSGGPGTPDPGTWSCSHVTLTELIHTAYDLELYEFRALEWMGATWFAIAAKVPAGTTKEQFRRCNKTFWKSV